MGGGLMQLVAVGAQDKFLIENPKITFYKTVYFRHTNFSMESIENYFNGNPKLGHRITSTINRNGDLLKNLWLEVEMEGDLCNSTGHSLIEYVELEIGGQIIDTQYGEWMEILSELTLPEEKRLGYNKMINKTNATTTTQIVFVTYAGTGTRSVSTSNNPGHADVIYCKLADGTIIGRYDLKVTANNIDIKLAENSTYIFDFDERTNPVTGDVQFVLTVNDVEVQHREEVKTPSLSSDNSETIKLEIYDVENVSNSYSPDQRREPAKIRILSKSDIIQNKVDSANNIINKKQNPPEPIYRPTLISTDVTSRVINDEIFEITIPFLVFGHNKLNEKVNVKLKFKATGANDHTVSFADQLDEHDKLKISVNLSELIKGVEYNGTIIEIDVNYNSPFEYTIPSELNSIGYIPTLEEIDANDYLVTNYSDQFVIYEMTSNTRRLFPTANPNLSFINDKTYKFLVKSPGHPFAITDASINPSNFEVVSGTQDLTGVDEGVYEFIKTEDSLIHMYYCTTAGHTESGAILNNLIKVDIRFQSPTITGLVISPGQGLPLVDKFDLEMTSSMFDPKIQVANTLFSTDDYTIETDGTYLRYPGIPNVYVLTVKNLSPDTHYELYNLRFKVGGLTGLSYLDGYLNTYSFYSLPDHYNHPNPPTFSSPSPPTVTTSSISWYIKQTNSDLNESITLSGIIGFSDLRLPDTRFPQNSVYDPDTKIITLTFSMGFSLARSIRAVGLRSAGTSRYVGYL